MERINCTVENVKNFVEDYNSLFWFDNAIYDKQIQGFRRATDKDFKTKTTNILRFLDCECTPYIRVVEISNTQFTMYNKDGEIYRDCSDDWQNYLNLTQIKLENEGMLSR